MGSEIVAGSQRSGTIHRTEIAIAPKKILNRSVIDGVTEIVQTREAAGCGGNNQNDRGPEVVPPGNGMRRIQLRPVVWNSGSFEGQAGVVFGSEEKLAYCKTQQNCERRHRQKQSIYPV